MTPETTLVDVSPAAPPAPSEEKQEPIVHTIDTALMAERLKVGNPDITLAILVNKPNHHLVAYIEKKPGSWVSPDSVTQELRQLIQEEYHLNLLDADIKQNENDMNSFTLDLTFKQPPTPPTLAQ